MDGLARVLSNSTNWLLLYLGVMVPTYLLPYLGSNSILAGAATLGATLPLFIIHLLCLVALCVFAYVRGGIVGKSWLVAMPIGAAVFDLIPVLNWVPLIPTVFHIIALVVGTTSPNTAGPDVFE